MVYNYLLALFLVLIILTKNEKRVYCEFRHVQIKFGRQLFKGKQEYISHVVEEAKHICF